MLRNVILPQLGMGMSEGSIAEWLVADGAEVTRDQPIATIETEKVVTELPAPYAGIVQIVAPASDVKLPVDTVIARIADSRKDAENSQATLTESVDSAEKSKPARPANVVKQGRIRASGLAKELARKNGVQLAGLKGTGPSGRILRRDVDAELARADSARQENASKRDAAAAVDVVSVLQRPAASHQSKPGVKARLPLTGIRKIIAERMVAASTEAAQTFCFFEIDVTGLAAWHRRLLAQQEALGSRIALTAIYAKALAAACLHVPICNATVEGDEILLWEEVNVGIAVALPGRNKFESSLVVPVVRNVAQKGIVEINEDIRRIVAAARDGSLTPDDMGGATITMSSTNGFAAPGTWMISTPLLSLPQVINFQPGSMMEKPLVVDGAVAIRTVLPASIVFDHRAMDGVPATKLVRKLGEFLNGPESMLL